MVFLCTHALAEHGVVKIQIILYERLKKTGVEKRSYPYSVALRCIIVAFDIAVIATDPWDTTTLRKST